MMGQSLEGGGIKTELVKNSDEGDRLKKQGKEKEKRRLG